jgi:transcriptional regulator with XRE-family HTH domain
MEHYQIDQGIRLKKLIKLLNLNQIEFARSVGVTQPNISKIVNGESSLSAELLTRMAEVYNQLNLHWLLTGRGEMFFDEALTISLQVNEDAILYKRNIEKVKGTLSQLLKDLEK